MEFKKKTLIWETNTEPPKNYIWIKEDGKAYEYNNSTRKWEESKYVKAKSPNLNDDEKLIQVTYNELVELRNNSKLQPGFFYRITDYITTTAQEHTYSAKHQFDVIVFALNESTLSEEAYAIQHEGDTYFANSNLGAWKIWYCLDNDTNRFRWALNEELLFGVDSAYSNGEPLKRIPEFDDSYGSDFKFAWGTDADVEDDDFTDFIYSKTEHIKEGDELYCDWELNFISPSSSKSGSGVIYRMIDEWNNDCPYDFKNILFEVGQISDTDLGACNSMKWGLTNISGWSIYDNRDKFNVYTFSIIDIPNSIVDDVTTITNKYFSDDGCYAIPQNNIIKNFDDYGAFKIPTNVFVADTEYIQSSWDDNGFYNCEWYGYKNCIIGNNCNKNIFNGDIRNINLHNNIGACIIANSNNITIKDYSHNIEISDSQRCKINEESYWIKIPTDCEDITIGCLCINIRIHEQSRSIYIMSHSDNITFNVITEYAKIGSGNEYLVISSNQGQPIQHLDVAEGINISSTDMNLEIPSKSYATRVAYNSNKVLRIYCPDDASGT